MLAHVPGTDEAKDAVMDTMIPQTSAVRRGEADLEVTYDGTPQFERIPGTSLLYARNTTAQVLKVEDRYYAVDQGVWYVSDSAYGPWAVAESRPEEVEEIPPSSPAYNVKYVYIYDYTPEVVYVGYLPGYTWAFPYRGAIVYGTGYYYRPWLGPAYYYPRPSTWGFHMHYDPWYGWGYGMSWSAGWLSFSSGWGSGWGGWGYGYPLRLPAGLLERLQHRLLGGPAHGRLVRAGRLSPAAAPPFRSRPAARVPSARSHPDRIAARHRRAALGAAAAGEQHLCRPGPAADAPRAPPNRVVTSDREARSR